MISWIIFVVPLVGLSLARSRNCLDDFDLPDGPLQEYNYKIPHGDEAGYWARIDEDGTGTERRVAFSRSFYIFGRFGQSSVDEDTTITAGLYKGGGMIYKTVINCNKGTWENWIKNKKGKEEKILHGTLNKTLTTCEPGENFDLILKNDNFHLANWILNAQPLQQKVRVFARRLNKVVNGKKEVKRGIKRPAVKVYSEPGIYNATHFRFEAKGGASFTRLAFGPCNAWPDNMESQCQRVRDWIHMRSKANLTDYTLAQLRQLDHPDANFTRGLGVFGNNRIYFSPICVSSKYFKWIQEIMHPDGKMPLYKIENGKKLSYPPFDTRAYCCCTDMRTGEIFNNDPGRNCMEMKECNLAYTTSVNLNALNCQHAFDAKIWGEIFKEREENGRQ